MIAFFQFKDTNVVYTGRLDPEKHDILQPIIAVHPERKIQIKLYFKKYIKGKRGALYIEATKAGEVIGG